MGGKKVRGVTKYLVRWKGYENADNSWESLSKLQNGKDSLLEESVASKKKETYHKLDLARLAGMTHRNIRTADTAYLA